jgi:hypothetical protein
MLVEIQSKCVKPIHPQHPPRSSDKNQQHLSDSNLYMTLNLSINEFIKKKSKNIHVKKNSKLMRKIEFFFMEKKKPYTLMRKL